LKGETVGNNTFSARSTKAGLASYARTSHEPCAARLALGGQEFLDEVVEREMFPSRVLMKGFYQLGLVLWFRENEAIRIVW
jgi:hypothetical protein